MTKNLRAIWPATMLGLLAACATAPEDPARALAISPWAAQSTLPTSRRTPAGWRHFALPGKRATHFQYAREDGRDAVAVTASASASLLRQDVRIEPAELGTIAFSWKVPQLISGADLASRERDDAPVRVLLVFDGDRSRLSARDAMLSELARAVTGEELPYATLMYVWGNRRPPGCILASPRTDRIRQVILESGPAKLNRWLDYKRNVRTDYERAFGEPPGALIGLALMSDTDNTHGTSRAWYGPVTLRRSTGEVGGRPAGAERLVSRAVEENPRACP